MTYPAFVHAHVQIDRKSKCCVLGRFSDAIGKPRTDCCKTFHTKFQLVGVAPCRTVSQLMEVPAVESPCELHASVASRGASSLWIAWDEMGVPGCRMVPQSATQRAHPLLPSNSVLRTSALECSMHWWRIGSDII